MTHRKVDVARRHGAGVDLALLLVERVAVLCRDVDLLVGALVDELLPQLVEPVGEWTREAIVGSRQENTHLSASECAFVNAFKERDEV